MTAPLLLDNIQAVDDGNNDGMNRSVFSLERLLRARSFLNDQYSVSDSCIHSVNGEHIFADVLTVEIDWLNDQKFILSQRLTFLG